MVLPHCIMHYSGYCPKAVLITVCKSCCARCVLTCEMSNPEYPCVSTGDKGIMQICTRYTLAISPALEMEDNADADMHNIVIRRQNRFNACVLEQHKLQRTSSAVQRQAYLCSCARKLAKSARNSVSHC